MKQGIIGCREQQESLRARVKALRSLYDDMRKNQAIGQAGSERETGEVEKLERERAEWKSNLAKLAPMVDANVPAIIAGRTWSVAELQSAAEHDLLKMEAIDREIAHRKRLHEIYSADAKSTGAEQDQIRLKFEEYEQRLELVDAKLRSLERRAAAVEAAGGSDMSLDTEFHDMEDVQRRVGDEVEGQRKAIGGAIADRATPQTPSPSTPDLGPSLRERIQAATR